MTNPEQDYPEKYRQGTNSHESQELSHEAYGFSVDDIDIENKYARDHIGLRIYQNDSESIINQCKTYLPQIITFLENARETTILKAKTSDIETYVKFCIEEKESREGTIKQALSVFGGLLSHIHSDRCNPSSRPYLTQSQIRNIDLNDFSGFRPPLEREGLERETVLQLIEHAGNRYKERDQLIILVIYETAIRNSDLRGLKLSDFKYDKKLLVIKNSKGDHPGTTSYKVPIRDKTARKIRHWIDVHRPAFMKGKESEYLFTSNNKEKFKNNRSICNIVKNAAENAGLDNDVLGTYYDDGEEKTISNYTPHVLRHSITTHLDELGLDDDNLRLLLGNTHTLDTYRRGSNKEKDYKKIRKGINKL